MVLCVVALVSGYTLVTPLDKHLDTSMPKNSEDIFARVEKYIKGKKINAPLEYLLDVMRGIDPRPGYSELYQLCSEVGEKAHPSASEWQSILDLLESDERYQKAPVDAHTSIRAAELLLGYLHPKRKAVEHSGTINQKIHIRPLTADDVKLAKQYWDTEFAGIIEPEGDNDEWA